jgi:hypothetical protein
MPTGGQLSKSLQRFLAFFARTSDEGEIMTTGGAPLWAIPGFQPQRRNWGAVQDSLRNHCRDKPNDTLTAISDEYFAESL